MADCSASGTAIDRVIQLAVASSQGHSSNGAAAMSAAAGGTTRAISNFITGTTSTAALTPGPYYADSLMMGGGTGGGQIMPLVPIHSLGGHPQYRGSDVNSSALIKHQQPSRGMTYQYQMPVHQGQMMMSMHPHTAPQQQNMMSMQHQQHHQMQHHHHQQQQMMMMQQQMQIQQSNLAAMVQYQNNQQQQQQYHNQQHMVGSNNSYQKSNGINDTMAINQLNEQSTQQQVDDDVATVSVEEEVLLHHHHHHHEGITNGASIERLAQAWRDAEAEYAQEFDDNDDQNYYVEENAGYYDASDMSGGRYSIATGDANGSEGMMGGSEPQYQFSDASCNYGCIQTSTTDIPPQSLAYPHNLYEQGMQHFDEGNISEAILCFESTLRNVDPEHADAWRMLGKCHTENDEDQKAIICWMHSLERDPFSPETLLALGVSYVNEMNHEKAIEMLKGWVENHPLYAGMIDDNNVIAGSSSSSSSSSSSGVTNLVVGGEDLATNTTADGTRLQQSGGGGQQRRMKAQAAIEMRDVERLMLRALEYDRTADAAADVYEALGVVYNVSRDYDAAADALRKAIEVRPMDYQLRNKLGATLANNNRSDEALPAYRAALSLKPKYARGWLNMAISHSNLYNYNEATRCYLQTLSLNPDARHVWSYLRIALTCDEKWDLLPFAASQNLSAFREYYDFVEY
jgi:peroxin-5